MAHFFFPGNLDVSAFRAGGGRVGSPHLPAAWTLLRWLRGLRWLRAQQAAAGALPQRRDVAAWGTCRRVKGRIKLKVEWVDD